MASPGALAADPKAQEHKEAVRFTDMPNEIVGLVCDLLPEYGGLFRTCKHFRAIQVRHVECHDECTQCKHDDYPLFCAIERGHYNCFRTLALHSNKYIRSMRKFDGEYYNSVMDFAAIHGRVDIMKFAIDHGYKMNAFTAIEAVRHGQTDVVQWIWDVCSAYFDRNLQAWIYSYARCCPAGPSGLHEICACARIPVASVDLCNRRQEPSNGGSAVGVGRF